MGEVQIDQDAGRGVAVADGIVAVAAIEAVVASAAGDDVIGSIARQGEAGRRRRIEQREVLDIRRRGVGGGGTLDQQHRVDPAAPRLADRITSGRDQVGVVVGAAQKGIADPIVGAPIGEAAQRIGAGTARDGIGAIAAGDGIGPGLGGDGVGALTAGDGVAAAAASDPVIAVIAGEAVAVARNAGADRVGARPAEDRVGATGRIDEVVAVAAVQQVVAGIAEKSVAPRIAGQRVRVGRAEHTLDAVQRVVAGAARGLVGGVQVDQDAGRSAAVADGIVAVAAIEVVVAIAAQQRIGAIAADEGVRPFATDKAVRGIAADQAVIAVIAPQRRGGGQASQVHRIGAGAAEDGFNGGEAVIAAQAVRAADGAGGIGQVDGLTRGVRAVIRGIGPDPTDEHVIAVAADERIVPVAARQRVVAAKAADGIRECRTLEAVGDLSAGNALAAHGDVS